MRKASRLMAVLMAVLLLLSVAAVGISADSHTAEPKTKPQRTVQAFSKAPTIDGKVASGEWGSPTITDKDIDKEGLLWSDKNDDGLTFVPMVPATFKGYLGWSESTFYFALEVTSKEHKNDEHQKVDLWKGDCLQIQIASKEGGVRYEMGFAYSTFGPKNRLAYQWFPAPKELDNGKKNGYFYVDRSGTTTTYEIALPAAMFGATKLTSGSKIPFSFALHVYDSSRAGVVEDPGCFYEWGSGVVGGDLEKDIKKAAVLTLGGGGTVTTTKGDDRPNTTTTRDNGVTTTKNNGVTTTKNNGVTTTKNNGVTTTTNKNDPTGSATAGSDTTTSEPTTTTTVAAQYEELLPQDITEVTDEAIVSALKEISGLEAVEVESGAVNGKFAIYANDFLTVYYLDGEEYKEIEVSEQDEENSMFIYENEAGAETIYMVTPAEPTTTAPETTTSASAMDNTTTKTTTTTAANDENGGGFPVWAIVLIIVVVVAGAGVAAFFIIKKKKENGGIQ